MPGLLPIICNAEEIVGHAAVREALDVFALQVGTNSLLKETTAASESLSVAPEARPAVLRRRRQRRRRRHRRRDPGCHSDGNPTNPRRYNPNDNDETDKQHGGGTSGSGDDDGGAQCADGRDNDGDGVIDADDPGCHTDGNNNNPTRTTPTTTPRGGDGDGGGGDAGSGDLGADELPFTGTDVIGIALAGLLVLAGGLLLRRREDVNPVA